MTPRGRPVDIVIQFQRKLAFVVGPNLTLYKHHYGQYFDRQIKSCSNSAGSIGCGFVQPINYNRFITNPQ